MCVLPLEQVACQPDYSGLRGKNSPWSGIWQGKFDWRLPQSDIVT